MSEDDEAGWRAAGRDPLLMAGLAGAAHSPQYDELVSRQVRLAELQIDSLEKQDEYELSHLRWRRFNDQMKGALQIMVVAVGALFVFAIGTALWTAAHENGLVIEAFSVPPDMAARGLTGQAVAAQLQDKLAILQAATDSGRPAGSYSNNWGNDIKVQIPNTGVSIGEFYRYLASWLGRQTHITGEVYRTGGAIAVTARAEGAAAATVSGADTDLNKLLQRSAEKIYEGTQPYRYAAYILGQGDARLGEGRKLLQSLAMEGSLQDRAWAHIGLGNIAARQGPGGSVPEFRKAAAVLPNFAMAYLSLDAAEGWRGHDEASLQAAQRAVRLLQGDSDAEMSSRSREITLAIEQSTVAFGQGDPAAALSFLQKATELPDYGDNAEGARETIPIAFGLLHDPAAERQAVNELPPSRAAASSTIVLAEYFLGDWSSIRSRRAKSEAAQTKRLMDGGLSRAALPRVFAINEWPYVAMAMAATGDFQAAHALIDRTPLDCHVCVLMRGNIDAAEKKWDAAEFWFAATTRQAPSFPHAFTYWGEMLLQKGDFDGAIAKFETAHEKGPHFADPLEMWGEALIAKNRSDLALAKFEEADKYAPNWGRLHLKWGEALRWAGRRDEAKQQFAVASRLDLAAAEKIELARARS